MLAKNLEFVFHTILQLFSFCFLSCPQLSVAFLDFPQFSLAVLSCSQLFLSFITFTLQQSLIFCRYFLLLFRYFPKAQHIKNHGFSYVKCYILQLLHFKENCSKTSKKPPKILPKSFPKPPKMPQSTPNIGPQMISKQNSKCH